MSKNRRPENSDLSSGATVLVLCEAGRGYDDAVEALGDRADLVFADSVAAAVDRCLLDERMLFVLVDARWPDELKIELLRRFRADRASPLYRCAVFVADDSHSSTAAHDWLLLGATAVVRGAHGLHELQQMLAVAADSLRPWVEIEVRSDDAASLRNAALNLSALIRSDDSWYAPAPGALSLRLRCDTERLLSPLSRLSERLNAGGGTAAIRVSLPAASYRL